MQVALILDLPTPEATEDLARVLAGGLQAGDSLLLEGPIGAGKSHLARALIRSRLGNPSEEVPSPSFTLVQTYPGDPPIWHADLYRLGHPDEVLELGLDAAFETDITLVEWPDRLGRDAPADAIRVALAPAGEGRRATIRLSGREALAVALREFALALFLARCGWAAAEREPLAGDASGRRFTRLRRADRTAVLLDNPPGLADRVDDYVKIGRHLRRIGLSAPEIFAEDLANGFLLLEDLGDDLLSRRLMTRPQEEAALYALACDALVQMQAAPAPDGLPNLSAEDWAEAALLALSFYVRGATGQTPDPGPLRAALVQALRAFGDGPRVLIHRDYFMGNLLLLPRPGTAALGLVDFQSGQLGQPVYDLVSLLQDARRDVAPAVEAATKARFATITGAGPQFQAAYAVWGVQRALRILGIFARLCLVEGRPAYLDHLPRVMRDLRRNLAHPGLEKLDRLCEGLLPNPTPKVLSRLRSQCGAFR